MINFIAKDCIEEKIYAGIQLKNDLFKGVFDGGEDIVEFSNEKKTALMNRLREMLNEEDAITVTDQRAQMEIPEDTPHYLNPKALEKEKHIPYDEEENTDAESFKDNGNHPAAEKNDGASSEKSVFAGQSPEQVENVLNQGMGFIGSLLEIATGKKIEATEKDGAMVKIDRETGEVTMKFKLPGF